MNFESCPFGDFKKHLIYMYHIKRKLHLAPIRRQGNGQQIPSAKASDWLKNSTNARAVWLEDVG